MSRTLLLEVGTEEIPAGFMEKALADLKELAERELDQQRLAYEEVVTYGTPRRLALMVKKLAEKQADVESQVRGPSKKAGLDGEGNYTKAALGFARGQGVKPEDLILREVKGVEYLFAIKQEKGQKTEDLLPQLLPRLITGLNFPKSMRWGDYDLRFARPIRWLLALFGQQVVEFELAGVKSDRFTYGHRFLAKEPLAVKQPEDYLAILEQAYVIADQSKRKNMIWEQVVALARQEGGVVKEDAELLAEVIYLVEYPTALCGSFAAEYLELPVEVLITPMREHQRYFPVYDEAGRLLNKFITVRNGTAQFLEVVRRGNEKVLAARLADAKFFYEKDLKLPLEDLLPKLELITFQEELGTVMAKVKRIEKLTGFLAGAIGAGPEQKAQALRVAKLAKADLVTNMVYEFPELQGIMGAYYARVHGEPEEVCQGIREHYLPRFAGDALPAGLPGWAVSMADKLDTIVGCFSVGIQPTGSQDPYALRRQALAICQMLLDREVAITLEQLLEAAYQCLSEELSPKVSKQELFADLKEFFYQRMRNILADRGHRFDVVEAVLAGSSSKFTEMVKWANALTGIRQEATFDSLLVGFNRASNLVKKGVYSGAVQEDLLAEPAEKELYQAFIQVQSEVTKLIEQGDHVRALSSLAQLQAPIDRFFTDIMVMVDDERIRNNRLAILNNITQFVKDKVDLTKIVSH